MSQAARPTDEMLPLTRLIPLAVQHVLVMYAGAVAVPLIVGGALKLPRDQVAMLINADLFACGIATLIQSFGVGWFGIRLPVMMGVTFASVSPMLAMAADPQLGLLGIYGAVIVAGIFGMLVAPFVSRMLPFFPSVVTGSIITVIGITLMRVGIDWAGGGAVAKDYGNPQKLAIALVVLLVILGIIRFARGFLQNIAVLIGIVAGYLITVALGMSDLSGFGAQSWLAPVWPFQFGFPTFNLVACISMCLVMIVVMIESTGMFLALGEITGSPVTQADLTRGLRADGLGTLIGGVFHTFPYTSFSQNVGLVGVTGIRSRFVCVAGGAIMIVLGLVPKLAFVAASVPQFVLGGAGIVMFGMVAATGIKILAGADFQTNRHNLFIVAVSIGMGMIPLVSPRLFSQLPPVLKPILDSGILLASATAVALNAYFNGAGSAAEPLKDAAAVARGSGHV